jgi:hypothetical protein
MTPRRVTGSDAGAPAMHEGEQPSDAELRALMQRARDDDDGALRRLVTGYLTLRRVGADVIAFLEARDGGASVARTPLLLHARHLTARGR